MDFNGLQSHYPRLFLRKKNNVQKMIISKEIITAINTIIICITLMELLGDILIPFTGQVPIKCGRFPKKNNPNYFKRLLPLL